MLGHAWGWVSGSGAPVFDGKLQLCVRYSVSPASVADPGSLRKDDAAGHSEATGDARARVDLPCEARTA